MPPATVTPEEKRQRRLLNALLALNGITIVLLLVGFGLGVMGTMTRINKKPVERDEHAMPGPTLEIFEEVYNLGEPNRYMNATMEIELDITGLSEQKIGVFRDEVRKREYQIRDLIIGVVSGKTYRDVSTPAGKEQLKEELRLKINAILSHGRIREVLFTNFAVQ